MDLPASEYLVVTEVRNEEGLTQFLQLRWARVDSDGKSQLHHTWRPAQAGTYQLRSFLTTADCNPEVLSTVRTAEIQVRPPMPGEKVVPALEDISSEEGRKSTRDEVELIEFEDIRRDEVRAEADDADIIRLEEKERRIRELIWSDERIVRYQQNVEIFGFDSDFRMDERGFCDDAEMTIALTRARSLTGDWETSYTVTHTGRSELEVTVVDGKISSIVENTINDEILVYNFTERQKGAIRIALADDEVDSLLQGREIEVGVRDFGLSFDGCGEHCALVMIYLREDRTKAITVYIDLFSKMTVSVWPSGQWSD